MLLEAIVLGALQGVLEWLPVSSQGNLVLLMVVLLGFEEAYALSLSVYLHIGTLLAVLVYFRNTILELLRNLPEYQPNYSGSRENRMISFLLFSTVLTGLLGYPIYRLAETTATFYSSAFIALLGISLIATGILQKWKLGLGNRTTEEINLVDTLISGLGQGFSAFPGISRSGTTTSILLFRGFKSEHALNLSFLMSVPAVLAAEIGLSLTTTLITINPLDIVMGCLSAFLFGIVSIHILKSVARKINFSVFCIAMGILATFSALNLL